MFPTKIMNGALTGGDENHIRTSQNVLDIGQRFLGSGLPHLRLPPCAKAACDARPEGNLHLKRVKGVESTCEQRRREREEGDQEMRATLI